MRNKQCLLSSAAVAGLCLASAASAQVLFQDGFEGRAVGTTVGPPTIGQSWVEAPDDAAPGADIVASPNYPVLNGTQSLRGRRETLIPPPNANIDLTGISNPGAIVGGQDVEVVWNHYWTGVHPSDSFNGPMQIAIGQVGSNFNNDLAFVYIADGNTSGTPDGVTTFPFHNYAYYSGPGQFGTHNQSLTVASLNAPGSTDGTWDRLRVVMHLAQLDATHMGGTMDLYVKQGAAAEIALGIGKTLETTDLSLSSDPTSMAFRIVKGGSSGTDFYDDVSITVVPEPAMLSLGTVVCGLFAMRRSRR